MQMRNSSNGRGDPEVETLLLTTLSYLDLSTKFCSFYSCGVSNQYHSINDPRETQQKVLVHSNFTGKLGNGRSGQHLVSLVQGWKYVSSGEGLSFYERPDPESCCSGSAVQKHPHLCCCYETRIEAAKSHHQRQRSSTIQTEESCRKGRVKGGNSSIQRARTTAGSCLTLHRLMCNTCTESNLLLMAIFSLGSKTCGLPELICRL